MLEYGEAVGQGGEVAGSGHASSGSTDIGAAIGASFTNALNDASAALGVSPTLLVVLVIAAVLLIGYFVFAR
jgi:hypothetical protein